MSDAPLFTVTGQTQTFLPSSNGAGQPGWLIKFTTASGVKDELTVSNADYTVDNVRALLTEKAETIEAIHNLEP